MSHKAAIADIAKPKKSATSVTAVLRDLGKLTR
jgi:hypothetical protein